MAYSGIEGFKINGGPALADPIHDINNAMSQIFGDCIPPSILLSNPTPRSKAQAASQTVRQSDLPTNTRPDPVPQPVSTTPDTGTSSDGSDSIDHPD
jgi:hypothetical protein